MQQQEVQLRYFTVTAPTAGVVGDVPVRVGNQVTPQTVLTTIDQNDTLEIYVQVPSNARRELKIGLPIRMSRAATAARSLATTPVNFISPRVDDQTQSVLVKGHRAAIATRSCAPRSSSGRSIVWKTAEGLVMPVTAALASTVSFRVRRRRANGPDGKPACVAKQRPIKVGPIVGDNYAVLDGLKAGRSPWLSRRPEARRRRADRGAAQLPRQSMFAETFIRRPILASVCSLVIILAGAIAIPTLPIAQFPELAPPQVQVIAFYNGASAQTVETAVTTPLEQAINGIAGHAVHDLVEQQRRHRRHHHHLRRHAQSRSRGRRRPEPHFAGRRAGCRTR